MNGESGATVKAFNLEDFEEAQYSDDEIWDFYSERFGLDFVEKDVAEKIWVYASPVFLVVGTIGNLLSAIVLFKLCAKVLTTCMYLFVVSIVDIFVLYIRCGNKWVLYLFEFNIAETTKQSSNSVCKLYPFVASFTLHLSIWLLVAMATETTIVTLRPERLLRVCVMERARAVILLIIVLLVCVNAHSFWTFNLNKEKADMPELEICSNFKQGQINEEFRKIVWPIIDILVTHFFPFFTIFSCTVIIITRRVKKLPPPASVVPIWNNYPMDAAAAKQFQLTILVICLAYLILMISKFAIDIFLFLSDPNSLDLIKYSFVLEAKKLLAESICASLHYAFLCSKFFIFIITSRKFRDELRNILLCSCCSRKPRRNYNSRCLSNRTPNSVRAKALNTPMLQNNVNHDLPTLKIDGPTLTPCDSLDSDEKKTFAITSVWRLFAPRQDLQSGSEAAIKVTWSHVLITESDQWFNGCTMKRNRNKI